MKILDTNLPGAGGVSTKKTTGSGSAKKEKSSSSSSSAGKNRGDSVQVSSVGTQIGSIRSELDKIPDVRMELVQELKAKVESGEYHRDAKEIADAMIRDALKHG